MKNMHHTIGRIAGKTNDYKICLRCGSVNWYENKECHICGNKTFREMTEKDADELLNSYEDDEIEIDV